MAADLRLSATWLARAMSGDIVAGDGSREFGGVSIDSRTVAGDALFVGVRGERFDGSDFAAAAIAAGAAGAVVPRGRGAAVASGSAVVIEADDTTAALQAIGHAVRVESGAKVVAITGSAGKTTTKEITAELLSAQYRVFRNQGNFNNHIGLPLSLIELRHRPEIAVVELGMNHAGEISALVAIAEPDVRVWTNVGDAHLGFFASIDAIADAKAEILERATERTLLVANADDGRVLRRALSFAGRTTTFGIDNEADVRAVGVVDRGIDGTSARVSTPVGVFELVTPLIGRANLSNLLAGIGVALEFGVPLDTIAERAARLRPAPHRGELVRLGRSVTLIDDSYNANPTAMKQALEVLAHLSRTGRRVAVLGEMLELGDHAAWLHEEVGRLIARLNIGLLMTVGGPPAAALGAAAVSAGMPRERLRHFATSEEAAEAVASAIRPGDLVLVKGSHGVRTDRVAERLKKELA